MTSFKNIIDYIVTGKLIKYYADGNIEKEYKPNATEYYSDKVLRSFYVIWNIGIYASPVIIGFLYQRGYFEPAGLSAISRIVTTAGAILIITFCLRGLSRTQNDNYVRFMSTLKNAEKNMTPEAKKELMKYDFEFRSWPVEYKCHQDARFSGKQVPQISSNISFIQQLWHIPYKIAAYFAIHTFGIRLIYPGMLGILQVLLDQSLLQGRSKLITQYKGERYKIETADKNHIDTMFVDKRNSTANGNTLVICCEGNAGFYEIGIMTTPIEASYSTLGWNHPGFAGSTGRPYPSQEQNAITAVLEFAENKLGFKREDIIIFGWSIGGYSASWAAMNYPDIKGLILDATFDDVLHLASHIMPIYLEPIVKIAIRNHVDLNVGEQLIRYPGPILLIRRTDDEVICLRPNVISTNRINFLLIKLLNHRFPWIVDDNRKKVLYNYLSVSQADQERFLENYNIDDGLCHSLLQSYMSEHSKSYPMRIGEDWNDDEKVKLALYLAKNYLIEYKATHCVPLPPDIFRKPFDIQLENDFVHL